MVSRPPLIHRCVSPECCTTCSTQPRSRSCRCSSNSRWVDTHRRAPIPERHEDRASTHRVERMSRKRASGCGARDDQYAHTNSLVQAQRGVEKPTRAEFLERPRANKLLTPRASLQNRRSMAQPRARGPERAPCVEAPRRWTRERTHHDETRQTTDRLRCPTFADFTPPQRSGRCARIQRDERE